MLQSLTIQNFTIITDLHIEFAEGMTVLTGETGAGKSILIDALLLALGERADSNTIHPQHDRCSISANFDINNLAATQTWLVENELQTQDECILRRVISRDGRSKSFINGQPVTLQQLRELGNLLVSIHGQHEHQTLLKSDKQRQLLDAYAHHPQLLNAVQTIYNQWHDTQQQLQQLQAAAEQRHARYELLKYQVTELEKLQLDKDEIKQLDQDQRQLAHAEQLISLLQQVLNLLSENESGNIINYLNKTITTLHQAQQFDTKLNAPTELLNNALIQIEEATRDLQSHFDELEIDPERLQSIEQRLGAIHTMARKHRVNAEGLITLQEQLTAELTQLENSDEQIAKLEQQLTQLQNDYYVAAEKLSQSRAQAANKLAPFVTKSLQQLNMQGGKFVVQLTAINKDQLTSYGQERIEFLVSTNPGQALQPLAKIVSGGELSRISLAIHVLTAQKDTTPTLIFDEVDVGIGGGTAEIVGRLLRTLGNTAQVLCVTHLAQVAALAHHHLQVGKSSSKTHTETHIQTLDKNAKIQELARMLGGVKITQQTLAHAQEMLEMQDG